MMLMLYAVVRINFSIIQCDSHNLPFEDRSFDVITCMLARWDTKEIHRVLKQNGIVIIEHIGCDKKKIFKLHLVKIHQACEANLSIKKNNYMQDDEVVRIAQS